MGVSVCQVIYMGVVLYAPALALNAGTAPRITFSVAASLSQRAPEHTITCRLCCSYWF